MRIKFKKSKQKELLINFKKENNLTWAEFSKFLHVKKGALLMWYHEKNLLPSSICNKVDEKGKYKKDIINVYKENWGKSKGGLNSEGNTKLIKKPGFSEELAELVGIILGDGNIHEFKKGKKKRSYMLRIAGDYKKDRTYLTKYVYSLCEKLFEIKPKINYQEYRNEMFVIIHSKRVIEFLKEIYLKSGNKIISQVDIPLWILKDEKRIKACLRGLIDTDGCIHQMSKKDPNLLRITFKNHNSKLLNSTRKAFIKAGFHPSKIICDNVIYLSRKEDITNYLKDIGFSNEKHINRLKQFVAP